jgi:hypothetical protein
LLVSSFNPVIDLASFSMKLGLGGNPC